MSRLLKVLPIVFVLVALIVACGTTEESTPGALPETGETPQETPLVPGLTPDGTTTADETPLVPGTPAADTTPTGEQVEVRMVDEQYMPQTLEVPVGTTVVWTNEDGQPHTVTSDEGLFDSNELANGDTFRYTFSQAGTYPYHCVIHPDMIGEVTVQ
ncbi:MAG: cupredoxin domain-containing protein [Anaerolineae bacterium]